MTLAGQSYQSFTLPGAVYPSGALRIVLLVARLGDLLPGSPAQTRVETLGHVGERIYREELHSPDVAATLAHMESSAAFQHAVAAARRAATTRGDRGLLRTAHPRRARTGHDRRSKLLIDEGGPYVLAPVHGDAAQRRPRRR